MESLTALTHSSAARLVWTVIKGIRPRPVPEGALLVLAFLLIGSFTIEAISPFETLRGSPRDRLMGPDLQWDFWNAHLLGTDQQGRDVFVRVLVGARFSLLIASSVVGIAGVIGLVLGMVAGYNRGIIEALLMRITDAVLAMPVILAALVLAVLYRPSVLLVIIALSINLWAGYARLIRGETLTVMSRDFIKLARVAGAGPIRIMARHVMPHVINTWVVLVTLQLGTAILAESSLSFLGAGVPPPKPAWGIMAAEGRRYIQDAWWVSLFPGIAIMTVVLSFNLVGDWLRDRLDPQLQ
jgi:peptide/nickel transport system permease protein